jgi:hypothetical protein
MISFLKYFTDTSKYLRNLLREKHQSLQALQGEQVELNCHEEAVQRVQTESPMSVIKWALNGVKVRPDGMRVTIENSSNLGNVPS